MSCRWMLAPTFWMLWLDKFCIDQANIRDGLYTCPARQRNLLQSVARLVCGALHTHIGFLVHLGAPYTLLAFTELERSEVK